MLANGYAASFASFNENSLFDRLVTGLRETRGYTLADEQNLLAPEYTIYYAIEADGSGRKIKPAVTLIYNTLDGNRSRMIMKVKRIWKESERVKKLEDLVDSVVKRVPACPTWVEPSSR